MGLTIGAAQPVPCRGDVAENLTRHVRLIRLASAHGAQALVFPELSLTGYELDLADRIAPQEPTRDLLRGSDFDARQARCVSCARNPTASKEARRWTT